MLSSLKHYDAEREEGFTLIELLVVVIIIGILAAIAIPVFLAQRERAWNSEAQSDLRNAAVSMETYYTDFGVYHADGLDSDFGYNPSPNTTLTVNVTAGTGFENGQVYCLSADHDMISAGDDWFLGSGGSVSTDIAVACPNTNN